MFGKQTRDFSRSEMQPPPPDQARCPCTGHLHWANPAVCALLSSGCGMRFAACACTGAGNDSQLRRDWGSHGPLPRLEALRRPLPQGWWQQKKVACLGRAAPSFHSRPAGLRATWPGAGQRESMEPPNPVYSLYSAFCPFLLASHSILMPALLSLGAWVAGGTHGGVITGHSRLRVRMEEVQPSAGTHQRPNQALAADRRGRAANEKGVPGSCSQQGFS